MEGTRGGRLAVSVFEVTVLLGPLALSYAMWGMR